MPCIEFPTLHSSSFLRGVSLVITLPKTRREKVSSYHPNSQPWNVHRKALVFLAKAVFTIRKESRPKELRSPHFVMGYVAIPRLARFLSPCLESCNECWRLKSCRRAEELGWESVVPVTTQRTLLGPGSAVRGKSFWQDNWACSHGQPGSGVSTLEQGCSPPSFLRHPAEIGIKQKNKSSLSMKVQSLDPLFLYLHLKTYQNQIWLIHCWDIRTNDRMAKDHARILPYAKWFSLGDFRRQLAF